jgi:hypothetical protein
MKAEFFCTKSTPANFQFNFCINTDLMVLFNQSEFKNVIQ